MEFKTSDGRIDIDPIREGDSFYSRRYDSSHW